jgi:hypothetical protein
LQTLNNAAYGSLRLARRVNIFGLKNIHEIGGLELA